MITEWHPTFYPFFFGIFVSSLIFFTFHKIKFGSFQRIAEDLLKRAEIEADNFKKNAELSSKQKILQKESEIEAYLQNEKKKLTKEEERLAEKKDKLENRLLLSEKKFFDLEKRESHLLEQKQKFEEEHKKILDLQVQAKKKLEELSGLSSEEAKKLLIKNLEIEIKKETAEMIQRKFHEAENLAEENALKILTCAINRLATPTVSEATVCLVDLPNEEIKGRIIGREGRNIRALEQATGVNFIIDETPNAIIISSFDPIRRQIAKQALSELVRDGRIHPTKIEEAVENSQKNIHKQIKQAGESAALKAGAYNLHSELITLLGKLKFRFSFGQNILDHSLEVSHLMGIMASELGLNVALAKRIGLLHDMGKAATHEIEGSHAIIGHDFALKYGESPMVANGIGCHHQEILPTTMEGSLCCAADAISAARPGARIEALEEYFKRLKKLESVAFEFSGVEKAFAMQAGKEIRVLVQPEAIDDHEMIHLARNLTKRIENDLDYSGKIKVTVIREKRTIEYAI